MRSLKLKCPSSDKRIQQKKPRTQATTKPQSNLNKTKGRRTTFKYMNKMRWVRLKSPEWLKRQERTQTLSNVLLRNQGHKAARENKYKKKKRKICKLLRRLRGDGVMNTLRKKNDFILTKCSLKKSQGQKAALTTCENCCIKDRGKKHSYISPTLLSGPFIDAARWHVNTWNSNTHTRVHAHTQSLALANKGHANAY